MIEMESKRVIGALEIERLESWFYIDVLNYIYSH